MGETSFYAELVIYLMEVLRWLFRGQCVPFTTISISIRRTIRKNIRLPRTLLFLIKGVSQQPARSWRVGKSGPAPHVVFEIGSEETWNKDLTEKPEKYARMGVQEYFAYDPNEPLLLRRANQRLFGWHLDASGYHMVAMQPRSNGSLWSPGLDSTRWDIVAAL